TDLARFEEIELDLRMHVEAETLLGCSGETALQYLPRIRGGRFAIRRRKIAEHARRRLGRAPPGKQLKGRWIRHREQVALVGARETFDRASVKAHALAEGALDLGGRQGDRL